MLRDGTSLVLTTDATNNVYIEQMANNAFTLFKPKFTPTDTSKPVTGQLQYFYTSTSQQLFGIIGDSIYEYVSNKVLLTNKDLNDLSALTDAKPTNLIANSIEQSDLLVVDTDKDVLILLRIDTALPQLLSKVVKQSGKVATTYLFAQHIVIIYDDGKI